MKKANPRVVYVDSQGVKVPGATTVISMLAKPQLITWANRLGLQGIDSTKYVDNLAEVGTLAHYLIMCHYKNEVADTSDFSENQVELAQNCLLSYANWESSHTVEPIMIETSMVSEIYKYGGTFDFYGKLDGLLTLLDDKTGKALYPEAMYQLAAYKNLLEEHGYPVEQCIALRIGREEGEGFEVKPGKNMDLAFRIFRSCLDLYYTIRDYNKESK